MSFRDIRGQDKSIHILQGYIEQSRLEGSYLFVGPEGVGKRLVARTLSKAINCLEGYLDSCDKCSSCMKIENNQHPDARIVDGSTTLTINPQACRRIENVDAEIKIENIRQLQRDISLKPYEAKRKLFIIDNAHKMTAEAQNALLKILEEPPCGTLIILITDKPALLFKTIISRCKLLKFLPFKREELKEILKKDYRLDNEMSHFLAYFSEGRLGRALRLKDIDFIREKNRIIDKFAPLRKPASLDSLAIQNKEDVRSCLNILAMWFRDIYLSKIGVAHSEIINFDRKQDLLAAMSRFSFLDLNRIFDSISNSFIYLEQNINIKLLLYELRSQLCKG